MKNVLIMLSLALALVSCVPPSTPQTRIGSNHAVFSKLSLEQQQLVRQGQIATGMPADAVYMAWGRPARIFNGSKDGKNRERWDYAATRPTYVQTMSSPYYHGPYGLRRYYRYNDPMMMPEVAYVPYLQASVWFMNGKVESWEREK
jgi:hypothetical protein